MFKYVAILFVFLAGLPHLVIVPDHLGHAPVHGLTFLAIGLAQVLWAIVFVRFARSTIFYWLGLGLSGGIVLLWVLTQLIMPPFAAEPEPIDVATIISKFAEIGAFCALLIFARRHIFPSSRLVIAGAAVTTLAVGAGMFFAGHAAELLFPQLAHNHVGMAHAHPEDTTHAHEDTANAHQEIDYFELEAVGEPRHAENNSSHVHNEALQAATGLTDGHLHEMIGSPAADSEIGITAATNHQHPAIEPALTDEVLDKEQEATLETAIDHLHPEAEADHSIDSTVSVDVENQSAPPVELQPHFAADHAHSDEVNLSPDHYLDSEILSWPETEANSAAHSEAAGGTIESPTDQAIQPAPASEMTDYGQDPTPAADSIVPDPAFGAGISWQQTPQFQPSPQYPARTYPSIQNSPGQLQMFRNRWHSVWSPVTPMIQPRPGW